MRRILTILAIALGLLIAALDVSSETETQEVWQQYVVAKKRYQHTLYNLLSHRWPDLGPTLLRQRDEQLTLIEMREIEFRFLLENHPDRIVNNQGLDAFTNFEWTESDTEVLRRENKQFASLESFLRYTREQIEADNRLGEARSRMNSMAGDPEYKKMNTGFHRYADQLDARLR